MNKSRAVISWGASRNLTKDEPKSRPIIPLWSAGFIRSWQYYNKRMVMMLASALLSAGNFDNINFAILNDG